MPKVYCKDKDGCGKIPSFGYIYKKPLFCLKHKAPDMVDVKHDRCGVDGCPFSVTFGYETNKPLRCVKHKADDMIDVKHPRCITKGCKERPVFGYKQGKPLKCRIHKDDDMHDVNCRKCNSKGCINEPTYGFDIGKPIMCEEHRLENMKIVTGKRCNFEGGCEIYCSYGFEIGKPVKCKVHQLDGMKNVTGKRCNFDGCEELCYYGFDIGKPIKCKIHQLDGMKIVTGKRCNFEGGCEIYCSYGFEVGIPTRCMTHKLDGMTNVVSKLCKLCHIQLGTANKYEDYCLRCFIYTFPDKPVTRNYKVKEKHMTDFIQSQYPNEIMTFDKRVEGGCSKRRPDCLIEKFSHSVIIECDENQHTVYDNTCEIARLNEIYTDLGDRPIVFIRFNPDDYIDKNGTKKASSFKYMKRGIPQIKKENEWQKRLKSLKEAIDFHIVNVPDEQVTTINLFYDGC